tara:strand:- start:893 stop:1072 length:180 start_codon:yes stop_codon:yes gene_type:complete
MQVGDLVRMILKDGAITSETGILLETQDNYGWKYFLIDGKTVLINILDYNFEVINEMVS